MIKGLRGMAVAAALALAALVSVPPAKADSAGVQVGVLSCNVESGWGFIIASSRNMKCTYSDASGQVAQYAGRIGKFGVDIGYVNSATIVWAVFAPTADLAPGALAGGYGGVTGSASVGIGAGANVLIGGSDKSISLQPVSIEGNSGLNVAGGLSTMRLKYRQAA